MRSEGSKRLAALDMTQRQIAARLGVGQSTVAKWIRGECVPIEKHQAAMLAAFAIPIKAWPNEWMSVCDVIIRKLAERAPELLQEIIEELERFDPKTF